MRRLMRRSWGKGKNSLPAITESQEIVTNGRILKRFAFTRVPALLVRADWKATHTQLDVAKHGIFQMTTTCDGTGPDS
jgi:hypothetical protein